MLLGEVIDGGELVDAGVVDQDIQLTEVFNGSVDDPLSLGGFGDIAARGYCFPTRGADG